MNNGDLEALKYPIGKFSKPLVITIEEIEAWVHELELLPGLLSTAVEGLTDPQLDTPYRPGGWSIRQVVHHIPDSHMNAYIRFKLAVTEENPVIKPYFEDRWAECREARLGDIRMSIDLLGALHRRWVAFLGMMDQQEFFRTYVHPEHHVTYELGEVVGMYAWHGKHHLNHVLQTKRRLAW